MRGSRLVGSLEPLWSDHRMNTVVMIMAGGKGSRLGPLTCHRAKPAMPFGGRYRIIDFVLSNFVNSGYRKIYVLTQYMASSLIKHLNRNWHLSGIDQFIEEVPAQMRTGSHWYIGTADAVYQNLNLIRDSRPANVAVFGGDHIYKIDVADMEAYHRAKGAALTIAAFPVPKAEASAFGVIQVDAEGRIIGFQEKPENPATIPGNPDMCLVSMGNYIFRTDVLVPALMRDAVDPESSHDFGKNVIPELVRRGEPVYIYDFTSHRVRGEPADSAPYWRDVGTIDSWFTANMELRSPLPTISISTTGSGVCARPSETTRRRASSRTTADSRSWCTTAWCARAPSSRAPSSTRRWSATTASCTRAPCSTT